MFKDGHFNIALNATPVSGRIAPWGVFWGCYHCILWPLRGWTKKWIKIRTPKQSLSAIRLNSDPVLRATTKFSNSETPGRMGLSFRLSNFWNYLDAQALSNDKSEVTPFHPNNPRNRCAESLYSFSL